MRRIGLAVFIVITSSCEPAMVSPSQPVSRNTARIQAAGLFTERYAHSRLSAWKIRAQAAGENCSVLMVETPIVMEESMVEAMHYGSGAYDVYEGGVQRFSRDRTFRGVAYRDGSGRLWSYGAVTQSEAESLKPCH